MNDEPEDTEREAALWPMPGTGYAVLVSDDGISLVSPGEAAEVTGDPAFLE